MFSSKPKIPKKDVSSQNSVSAFSLQNALMDFYLARQSIKCTDTTLKNYHAVLDRFVQWLETQGITAPQEVTARHVREYLAASAHLSDWTQITKASRIRALLNFWHKEGYISKPIKVTMPKMGEKRLPFLNADQVQQLLKVCTPREKALVMFLVDSGLRRQELCNLTRQDIDLKTGMVRVRQGKGKKDRLAMIGATTRRALLAYLRTCRNRDDNAPLFQTESGKVISGYGLQSIFRRLSEKAGFKVTPHMLRRSFATLALKNGMDIVSLQGLMGHSNLVTTRKYIQWLDEDLLAAHRRASPIDNLKSRKE